ncbi:hypothetical protein Tco_1379883 [Tanacetum coccineum]
MPLDTKSDETLFGGVTWWFKRKEFYITRHSVPSDCSAVRSHMRILSVISLKKFERYDYAFLREIVIRRADYKEYNILKDFKNLHPNDFEDLYMLHLQGKLNHLPRSDKVHLYHTPNMDALGFLFKEDFTIVSEPRALDHMVKDFSLFEYNRGMENRIWLEDNKRRFKELIEVIERRLKIRRIFKNLESFV